MSAPIQIIGGGLAGSECAYQLARRGVPVELWEMRPERSTEAHHSADLGELVCSNSLRSDDPHHAAGLLKREMEAFGSLIIAAARRTAVPAGSALAVDRVRFAAAITATLEAEPGVRIRRQEVTQIPDGSVVLATGPLTSPALSRELGALLGGEHLYFYDAIAPIVDAESLDVDKMFRASRWDKGGDDYLNSPLERDQYLSFHSALVTAQVIELREFERALFFEGCLPIEELARRGVDTLRFGPMKPVGLRTPDGRRPWAVVQLRQENLAQSHYNLVGFQSRMTWPEQQRVLRTLPGLEAARFVRYGQIHRNTFVNAPLHLDAGYRLKRAPRIRLAGQITGVEGYLESAATGLLCALYQILDTAGDFGPLPTTTALGALARHLTESSPEGFQPANINYGLFEPLSDPIPKKQRRAAFVERAERALDSWRRQHPAIEQLASASPPAAVAGA